MMKLGTSKICITPTAPLRLCGFGFRNEPFKHVRKDIFVRAFVLQDEGETVTIIYGDLLWWNTQFVSLMKEQLEQMMGLDADKILFVASHNHSGPGTGESFIPLLETVDKEYLAFLQEKVREAIRTAENNKEDVILKKSVGKCPLNVYRRVMTENGIKMKPNYQISPDQTLTIFSFYRTDGSLKGRMVHYPCHANLSKDNDVHPDYPGYTLDRMDREYPGSISIFLQGCTADMRPNCVLGDDFRSGSPQDVIAFADSFYSKIASVVASREELIYGHLELKKKEVALKVEQKKSLKEIENELKSSKEEMRQWAKKVLEKGCPDTELLKVWDLRIGEQHCFFFNAEVSMHYAAIIRNLHKEAVCSGYTNGMIGYLSSAQQIKEGGYEPEESAIYFAVAGTYAEGIEKQIIELLQLF